MVGEPRRHRAAACWRRTSAIRDELAIDSFGNIWQTDSRRRRATPGRGANCHHGGRQLRLPRPEGGRCQNDAGSPSMRNCGRGPNLLRPDRIAVRHPGYEGNFAGGVSRKPAARRGPAAVSSPHYPLTVTGAGFETKIDEIVLAARTRGSRPSDGPSRPMAPSTWRIGKTLRSAATATGRCARRALPHLQAGAGRLQIAPSLRCADIKTDAGLTAAFGSPSSRCALSGCIQSFARRGSQRRCCCDEYVEGQRSDVRCERGVALLGDIEAAGPQFV